MRIGVPTEIKDNEYRVGMTPAGAAVLHTDGHEVFVQAGAGNGSGFSDDEYKAAGAKILPDADAVYDADDMIVKVKEPIEADLKRLKDKQLLFTYLHLAPVPDLTAALLKKKIAGIAYETITDERRRTLPLLTPMSEVAGRMSVHVGAYYLHKPLGGRGVLMGGVLIPGASAPKLVTRQMVGDMKKGSVIVDVAIDQGGCVETAHPTTHSDPVYVVDGVTHYCVANMPGAVPRTSTIALTNATLPYTRKIASGGFDRAIEDPGLAEGVNVYNGAITYKAVAESQGRDYVPLNEAVA